MSDLAKRSQLLSNWPLPQECGCGSPQDCQEGSDQGCFSGCTPSRGSDKEEEAGLAAPGAQQSQLLAALTHWLLLAWAGSHWRSWLLVTLKQVWAGACSTSGTEQHWLCSQVWKSGFLGSDRAGRKMHLMEPLMHRQIGGPGAGPIPSLARKPRTQSEESLLVT